MASKQAIKQNGDKNTGHKLILFLNYYNNAQRIAQIMIHMEIKCMKKRSDFGPTHNSSTPKNQHTQKKTSAAKISKMKQIQAIQLINSNKQHNPTRNTHNKTALYKRFPELIKNKA